MRHIVGKITGTLLGFKIVIWLFVTATSLVFAKANPKPNQNLAQSDDCPYEAKDGKSENIRAIRYG